MKNHQQRANALIAKGTQLRNEGRLREAIEAYRKAVALVPAYGSFHFVIGDMLLQLERHQEAAEAYRAAVEFMPDHDQAWSRLGQCQLLLGAFEQARLSLEHALALNPQDGKAHYYLAMLDAKTEDHKSALAHLKTALKLLPHWETPAQQDPLLKRYFEDPAYRAKLRGKIRWRFWRREKTGGR